LEQSEGFANLNPKLAAGDEVYIRSREGDDYAVEIVTSGWKGHIGRVPVSAVDIIAGDPHSGARIKIPPMPQSSDVSAPGYVPPPPEKAPPFAWFTDYVVPFMVFCVFVGFAGAINRSRVNASSVARGEADYGVPHTNFRRTEDGFQVQFSRSSEAFYRGTHSWQNTKGGGAPLAAIAILFFMILGLFLIIFWFGVEGFFKTVITVDRDSVTINGKKMSRSDFGHFSVHHSMTTQEGQVAVLGYQFGQRSFPFGGVWDQGHAQEVASAINGHLREVPLAGDEHSPSPEALRVARPTDF
jgi:hypothetical protein